MRLQLNETLTWNKRRVPIGLPSRVKTHWIWQTVWSPCLDRKHSWAPVHVNELWPGLGAKSWQDNQPHLNYKLQSEPPYEWFPGCWLLDVLAEPAGLTQFELAGHTLQLCLTVFIPNQRKQTTKQICCLKGHLMTWRDFICDHLIISPYYCTFCWWKNIMTVLVLILMHSWLDSCF